MNFEYFKKEFEVEPVIIENSKTVTKNPQVSICIQTYNQENFIAQCIESILLQKTDFPFEILLADDDSNDKTRDICKLYAKKHPNKIRLLLHSRKNNIEVLGKPSANFITLYNLFSARGKFIAICEGDDFWGDPYKLQNQYNFMISNPAYSVCYHDYKPVNQFGNQIETNKVSPLRRNLLAKELILPWVHPAPLTIFFKNIMDNIPIEATRVLTLDSFLSSILGNYGPGKFLKEIQPSFYRLSDQSIWANQNLEYKLLNKINTYKQIASYYKRIGQKATSTAFRKRVAKLQIYLIYYYLKRFDLIKLSRFNHWNLMHKS